MVQKCLLLQTSKFETALMNLEIDMICWEKPKFPIGKIIDRSLKKIFDDEKKTKKDL